MKLRHSQRTVPVFIVVGTEPHSSTLPSYDEGRALNQRVSVPPTIKKKPRTVPSECRSFVHFCHETNQQSVFQSFRPHVVIDTDSNYID